MTTQDLFRTFTTKRKNDQGLTFAHPYQWLIVAVGLLFIIAGSVVIGFTKFGALTVIGVIGIGVTLTILARPHFGMYILIIFMYTNMSTVLNEAFGVPSLNKLLVALIFVAVIGTRVVIKRKPLLFRISEGAIFLYVLIAIASAVLSASVDVDVFDNVLDISKDFLIIIIIVQLASEEDAWKTSQWFFIACAVGLSLLTWYQFGTKDFANDFFGFATSRTDAVEAGFSKYIAFYRVGGPVGDPNFYAQLLLMVVPLSIYRFFDEKNPNAKLIAGVSIFIICGAIIFTYSRATLLVMGLIIGLILLERRVAIYKIVIGGVLLFILILPILPKSFTARMATVMGIDTSSTAQEDVSTQGRLSEALVALQMFNDYPILGIGYSQYEPNYQAYSSRLGLDARIEERQAHNLYLETAAETGIIGLAGMAIMLFFIYRAAIYTRQTLVSIGRQDLIPWAMAYQFGLLAYLINSIFLHDDYARYLRLMIGFVVASSAMVATLQAKMIERQKHSYRIRVADDIY